MTAKIDELRIASPFTAQGSCAGSPGPCESAFDLGETAERVAGGDHFLEQSPQGSGDGHLFDDDPDPPNGGR